MRVKGVYLRTILGILLWVCVPSLGRPQPPDEVIQEFTHGGINWTRGKIYATGQGSPADHQFGKPVEPVQAEQNARSHLLEITGAIRINATTRLTNFSAQRSLIFKELQHMVDTAMVTRREYLSDGSLTVAVEMDLWGGLAQLVLPEEIRQVDVVRTVGQARALGEATGVEKRLGGSDGAAADSPNPIFTGLVLDARGVNLRPALVPVIRDESGQEVYGPVYASREFVVQHGMCLYLRNITGIRVHPRVRFNPLILPCMPASDPNSTDLVIREADAAQLRGASEHLTFLREGRVIIVVD